MDQLKSRAFPSHAAAIAGRAYVNHESTTT